MLTIPQPKLSLSAADFLEPQNRPDCSVVVPTFNEAANIRDLVRRLKAAIRKHRTAEVIFIDDSPDTKTVDTINAVAEEFRDKRFTIRSLRRKGKIKWGGLAGAVIDGIMLSNGHRVVVMDGDLQHPPELVSDLIRSLDEADIVIASRYVEGGSTNGLSSGFRRFASRASTRIARLLFPKSLRKVSDPMTGFFAFKRQAVALDRLRPNGFKILLEILVRLPALNKTEVPLQFAQRNAGESKATFNQGIEYLKHLLCLRWRMSFLCNPRFMRTIKFGFVGGGVFVAGSALLFVLVELLKMNPIVANGIQLVATLILNYLLNKRFTWGDRGINYLAATKYWLSRSFTTLLSFMLFAILVSIHIPLQIGSQSIIFSIHYMAANIITLLTAMGANYVISDKWVFANAGSLESAEAKSAVFKFGVIKYTLIFTVYVGTLLLFLGIHTFWPAFLATISLLLFTQASVEVWRMLYSHREPDAVDNMKFPEPLAPRQKFCLIVPARHEESVLATTLEELAKQTHPNVTILSVICHDDQQTLEVARQSAANSSRIQVLTYVIPPGTKPSKPLQLNHALKWMEGKGFTVVGVFDAEDTVAHDLLAHVDTVFRDKDTQIVQGGVQLMNYNQSWFSLHNVLEYWKWFSSVMQYQSHQRFVPLGGNTVFIRYKLLKKAGGWPLSLTEDCALGVLLSTRFNAKTVTHYEPRLATQEETPPDLKGLFFQRVRWMQGFYHEWLKGVWYELPSRRQRLVAMYILMNPTIQAFAAAMIPIALTTLIAMKAPVGLVLIMYLPMIPLILQLLLNVVYLHDFAAAFKVKISLSNYINLLVMHIPYQFILNFAAAWAMVRELRGDNSWHKTSHSGKHRLVSEPAAVMVKETA